MNVSGQVRVCKWSETVLTFFGLLKHARYPETLWAVRRWRWIICPLLKSSALFQASSSQKEKHSLTFTLLAFGFLLNQNTGNVWLRADKQFRRNISFSGIFCKNVLTVSLFAWRAYLFINKNRSDKTVLMISSVPSVRRDMSSKNSFVFTDSTKSSSEIVSFDSSFMQYLITVLWALNAAFFTSGDAAAVSSLPSLAMVFSTAALVLS